jgi:acyl carrier protein
LLWFWNSTDGVWFYRKDEVTRVRERIISTLCANLEVRREHFRPDLSLREIGPDSLDTVELAMELEEEFEVTIPDDESEKIRTRGDLVDCLLRRRL